VKERLTRILRAPLKIGQSKARVAAAGIVAMLLVVGTQFGMASPALADMGTPYNGCWQASGTTVVETAYDAGGNSVSLWWSPMCGTNWATFSGCEVDVAYVENTAGDRGNVIAGGCAGYTAMVDGWYSQDRAVGHGVYSGWFWTNWH
jgi:hypothetical protein